MVKRHERVFLSAFQKLFFRRPREGKLLLERFGAARAVFEADVFAQTEMEGIRVAHWDALARFRAWGAAEEMSRRLQSLGGASLSLVDPAYPPLLRDVYDAPPVISVRGRGKLPSDVPAVAIVGSRKATRLGLDMAAEIAGGLAAKGFIIVSGMAYGIDAAAHRGALSAGGATIAVLGCGPDVVYPPSHQNLARDIMRAGLLLSEFPLGEQPLPANFPQRNRIISGLSVATVIVEAEARSGSLITARFALEQGREVMAVPGPASTPRARGTNGLIREGALLVEGADDVAEALQPLVVSMGFTERAGHLKNDADKDTQIFGALSSRKAVGIDELAARTGSPVRHLLEELTLLALEGRVEELPGRRWRLKEKHG
jgi:DNA processing protein